MRTTLWLVFALSLTACGGTKGGEAPAGGGPEAAGTTGATRISGLRVTPTLQQKWGVTAEPPGRATVTTAVTLPGVLRLDGRRTVQITSLLDGQVVSADAELGSQVRKGQVLAVIRAPALAQAKTAFLQAAARAELTAREYERARVLLAQEAVDQKETLRRRAESDQARTERGIAESNLHSYGLDHAAVDALLRRAREPAAGNLHEELVDPYLQLTSPVTGRIIERDVIVGQHVLPDRALFTVSDLSTLWGVLDAREPDLPFVAAGRVVRIRTSSYPDRSWDGRVLHVGDVVDEESRTVKIRVETPNAGLLLKPNMFVQGEVLGAAGARPVLTVPVDAIQSVNGEPVVFVRTASDRFIARPVEPGERAGGRCAVLRGLDGTEQVVVTGAFNLKAELLKTSLAGE